MEYLGFYPFFVNTSLRSILINTPKNLLGQVQKSDFRGNRY